MEVGANDQISMKRDEDKEEEMGGQREGGRNGGVKQ